MHDIQPYHHWRGKYTAETDKRSPFYGREYDEFLFTQKIYNYFIHPQWDNFGSQTLYIKILFVDYETGYCFLELLGEWNDSIGNDIMFLKRNIADFFVARGIKKFIIACDNVLNFHGSDECYYEEWYEDVSELNGWVALLNTLGHVEDEMRFTRLNDYVHLGNDFNFFDWRASKPLDILKKLDHLVSNSSRELPAY